MTSPEEPKPLKALYIVGPDSAIPDNIKTMFDNRQEDCLIIGDGTAAVTTKDIKFTLEKNNFKITKDTRIDIHAHANRTDDGKHVIQINTPKPESGSLTEQLFQELSEMACYPLYVHLWSCYGGSANKAVRELGNDSILVTHIESKAISSVLLNTYSREFSLERYLKEDLTPYQQFIRDFPENFEAATFNKVRTDGSKVEQFKFTRMRTSKDKKMADILKNLSAENNLTDYFNDFFKQEEERFQDTFKDADVTNAINSVSKLDKQTIKTFAEGVLMHLCGITTDDDELDSLKELLNKLLEKGTNVNDSTHGMTFLHWACSAGKINVVKILLENGANINAKDKYDHTPLHFACEERHSDIVKILLDKNADINAKDKHGNTPLHFACHRGHSEVVKILLANKDVNINAKDKHGNTPLHFACHRGHSEVVKILLANKDVNINAIDNYGNTPLHSACHRGHSEVVKILLANKDVSINAKDKHGNTPLNCACDQGHIEVVKILLANKDANINAIDENGNTPLHSACHRGHSEVVKILLANKDLEINAKNKNGDTPLYLACKGEHIKVVKVFQDRNIDIDATDANNYTFLYVAFQNVAFQKKDYFKTILQNKEIDVNAKDANGDTLLHLACQKNHIDFARILLKNGADVNAENADGKTPLHFAWKINCNIVEALLAKGAEINANDIIVNSHSLSFACQEGYTNIVQTFFKYKENLTTALNIADSFGTTLLHTACKGGHSGVVEILLANDAEINAKDNNGDTPLHKACQRGRYDVVKILLANKNAEINAKNNKGKTPLDVITKYNEAAIVPLIEAAKKSMQSEDEKLTLDKTEKIDESLVNPLLHDDQPTNPELTELAVLGHVGYCHVDYSPCE